MFQQILICKFCHIPVHEHKTLKPRVPHHWYCLSAADPEKASKLGLDKSLIRYRVETHFPHGKNGLYYDFLNLATQTGKTNFHAHLQLVKSDIGESVQTVNVPYSYGVVDYATLSDLELFERCFSQYPDVYIRAYPVN